MLLAADDLAELTGKVRPALCKVSGMKKPRPEGRGEPANGEETPCGEEKAPATAPPPGELPHYSVSARM